MFDDMINAGIFGMKRSGKTTLARKLIWHFWRTKQQRALVLDPKGEWWPECATVFKIVPGGTPEQTYDQNAGVIKTFWDTVWANTSCVVVVDEAAMTISRDRNLMPAFTMMNSRKHRFVVVGHSGADLLPGMRQQLDYLFLFLQSGNAAEMWRDEFNDEHFQTGVHVADAITLGQFEYICASRFQPAIKYLLTK
jgi:hypothetical protein